jgi:hypothetical protein
MKRRESLELHKGAPGDSAEPLCPSTCLIQQLLNYPEMLNIYSNESALPARMSNNDDTLKRPAAKVAYIRLNISALLPLFILNKIKCVLL